MLDRRILLIFLLVLFVYMISITRAAQTGYEVNQLALSYAIWKDHFLNLGPDGHLVNKGIDLFEYNGRLYLALPPGLAIFSVPFTSIGFILDDGRFDVFGHSRVMALFFVALCGAASAALVYKICRLYSDEVASSLVAFGYAFATLAWVFSSIFYAQQVTAFFGLLALYMALRSTKIGPSNWNMTIAGLSLAASIMMDPVSIILAIFLSSYLLYIFKRKALLIILSVLGIVMLGSYNYLNFGNAFITSEDLYHPPEYPQLTHGRTSVIQSFSTPLYFGLFANLLSTYKGLLVYVPLAALGIVGLTKMPRRESILLIGLFFSMAVPYSLWIEWGGGQSYGPRYLVPVLSYLIIPIVFLVKEYSNKASFVVLFYALYLVGCVVAGVGALQTHYGANYVVNPSFEQIMDIRSNLFLRSLSEFLQYKTISYFFSSIGLRDTAIFTASLITIMSVCSIPIVLLRRSSSG